MGKNLRFIYFFILPGLILLNFSGCVKKPEPASLVLLNGDIYTVDSAFPEAKALVITGNKIAAVCKSDREAKKYIGKKNARHRPRQKVCFARDHRRPCPFLRGGRHDQRRQSDDGL